MTHATEQATLITALEHAGRRARAVVLRDGRVLVEETPEGPRLPQASPAPGESPETALSHALDALGLAHTRLSYLSAVWSYAPDPATGEYVDQLESFFRVEPAGDPHTPLGYAWVTADEAVMRLSSAAHSRALDELVEPTVHC